VVVLVADCNPFALPRVGQGVGAVQVFLPRQNLKQPPVSVSCPPSHPQQYPTLRLVLNWSRDGEFYTGANLLNAMEATFVL